MHAEYGCRRSGACCTANWAIPVEAERRVYFDGAPLLTPAPDGACRYFDRTSRLCLAQRDHGHAALPIACQQFPRVALHQDDATYVTLSHFCPTAASLLFDDGALAIVADPPAFTTSQEYEGLDARGEWPPLVHRRLLFDVTAYRAWQARVVRTLADAADTSDGLHAIASAAERLRSWTPAQGSMSDVVEESFAKSDATALRLYDSIAARAYAIVHATIPTDLQSGAPPAPMAATLSDSDRQRVDRAVRRYLAAKAFGTWTAYQGRGVRTLVAELVLAHALVMRLTAADGTPPGGTIEGALHAAIRNADLMLVHLADRRALVAALGSVEGVRQYAAATE
jgi:hypothetical protein